MSRGGRESEEQAEVESFYLSALCCQERFIPAEREHGDALKRCENDDDEGQSNLTFQHSHHKRRGG